MMAHRIAAFLGRFDNAGRAHPYDVVAGLTVLALGLGALRVGPEDLFASPDQRARWRFDRAEYDAAASTFADPLWRGIALFRAGDFKQAAQVLGGLDTPEAAYDQGNALVMLGRYDEAVRRYARALELRPGWPDAEANRALARLRAERTRRQGGVADDTESRPDEVLYDRSKKDAGKGEDTQVAGGPAMSDEAARALWLRRVQTRPADFLRAKFSYQVRTPTGVGAPQGPGR
jgi:Ca-activated chloride channel family protein